MAQGEGSACAEARSLIPNFDKMVIKLKDHELKAFPVMPEGRCSIVGNFLNCVSEGKFRLDIPFPARENCPACGVYLKQKNEAQ